MSSETVQHIVSGCSQLASKGYTERHNQVANIILRAIWEWYGLSRPSEWWELPEKVIENDQAKVLWDFYFRTDKQVIANKPDIVVVDKNTKYTTTIDISIPNDRNIKIKELEKGGAGKNMEDNCNGCPCGGWSLGYSNTQGHPLASADTRESR